MRIRFPALSTIVIYLVAILLCSYFAFKIIEVNTFNNSNWTVHSINYGFVIVEDENGEQILARNPTPNLKEGDKVSVQGFDIFSSVPYVDSKVE